MSWTCPQNVSIKTYFMDTLLRRGYGLDMKIEVKRPKKGRREMGMVQGGMQVRTRRGSPMYLSFLYQITGDL